MCQQALLVRLLGISGILAAILVLAAGAFAQEMNEVPGPPAVDVETILSRESLERGESTTLYIIVSNRSNVPLRNVRLSVMAEAFDIDEPSGFPDRLPAFGSVSQPLTISPRKNADFTQHALLVLVEYLWIDGEAEFMSVQTSSVTISVKRQFEDELGGLLGGGAAVLYFLLPLYPAVAAYQLMEQRRRGEALKLPVFGPQYVIPAGIASVAANLGVRFLFGLDYTEDLLDVGNFFAVVLFSVALGALIPATLAIRDWWYELRWSYNGQESEGEILRKALTGPRARQDFSWMRLTSEGASWAGILLEEGDNRFVLGVRLQASASPEAVASIEREVLAQDGTVHDARRLVRMVKEGQLNATPLERILHGNEPIRALVVVRKEAFQREHSQDKTLVQLVP